MSSSSEATAYARCPVSTAHVQIHPTADVSSLANIGPGTKVWHHAQIREGAQIGRACVIGKGVYIGLGVVIGNQVKIQNGASIYRGVTIEDGVFIGPHACLTNDKLPRAITPEGQLKQDADWEVGEILVQYGASIGAGAVVLPGLTVGRFAMVGAGAVVTKDVAPHGLVVGSPAELVGFVCACGHTLAEARESQSLTVEKQTLRVSRQFSCPVCGRDYTFYT
jgi:UDP-2-acetamido-3-amino-2,3-dideoxy-glucuronate N-acetyltransferase